MKVFLVGLALAGCSYTVPYIGPPGPPTMDGVEWLWPHGLQERWTRETTLYITNRWPTDLDVVLDCDPEAKHARKWMGSRMTIHLPARTTVGVLLDPHDHDCKLLEAE